MPDKTDHDILRDLEIKTAEIHSVLLGNNGNPGLCKVVRENTKSIMKIWIAIVVIAMSVGGGAWGIVSALIGG